MALLELHNLRTGYKTAVVSHDINAQLRKGTLTCLLGPNGAGKSTLLRTLCAFQPALGGKILLADKPLQDYTPQQLSRQIGVVLTDKVEVQGLSVHDLIAMGRSPYTNFWGSIKSEDETLIDEAIQLVGIQELAQRQVSTLSDGERQKVMIAKALAQQTPLIFLDEPTAFLDFPSKVDIMMLLSQLAQQRQMAILVSTHDLDMALQVADALWLLSKDHGMAVGTPRQLAQDGTLNRYFQSPHITFDAEQLKFNIIK